MAVLASVPVLVHVLVSVRVFICCDSVKSTSGLRIGSLLRIITEKKTNDIPPVTFYGCLALNEANCVVLLPVEIDNMRRKPNLVAGASFVMGLRILIDHFKQCNYDVRSCYMDFHKRSEPATLLDACSLLPEGRTRPANADADLQVHSYGCSRVFRDDENEDDAGTEDENENAHVIDQLERSLKSLLTRRKAVLKRKQVKRSVQGKQYSKQKKELQLEEEREKRAGKNERFHSDFGPFEISELWPTIKGKKAHGVFRSIAIVITTTINQRSIVDVASASVFRNCQKRRA